MTKPLFDSGRGVTVEVNLSPSGGPLFRAYREGVMIATFDHLQEVSQWLELNIPGPSTSKRDHGQLARPDVRRTHLHSI